MSWSRSQALPSKARIRPRSLPGTRVVPSIAYTGSTTPPPGGPRAMSVTRWSAGRIGFGVAAASSKSTGTVSKLSARSRRRLPDRRAPASVSCAGPVAREAGDAGHAALRRTRSPRTGSRPGALHHRLGEVDEDLILSGGGEGIADQRRSLVDPESDRRRRRHTVVGIPSSP